MFRRTLKLFFIPIYLLLCVAQAQNLNESKSPFVYQITIEQCAQSQNTTRQQTGFQVNGVQGLVTALHGILDCAKIDAYSEVGDIKLFDLELNEVDIERDLAILTPNNTQETPLPDGGLEASETADVSCEGFYILGYALTTQAQAETPISQQGCSIEVLSPIVTNSIRKALGTRKSPSLELTVYRLPGDVVPGHSGAPLINAEGKVVGVAQGGLDDGRVGVAWAAIWADRNFALAASKNTELELLSNMPLEGVFAIAINPDTGLGQLVVRFDYNLGKFEDVVVDTQGRTGRWQLEPETSIISDAVSNVIINKSNNENLVSGSFQNAYFEKSKEKFRYIVEREGPTTYFLSVLPNEPQNTATAYGISMMTTGIKGQIIGTDLPESSFAIGSRIEGDYPYLFWHINKGCLMRNINAGTQITWDDIGLCN